MAVVREAIQPKPPLIPSLTPCNSAAPIEQEEEFRCSDPATQQKNVSRGRYNRSLQAIQPELGRQASKYRSAEVANNFQGEQSSGTQHLANIDGWPPADHDDELPDQATCPNDQSSPKTATLIQYESSTLRYPSRKRKHDLEREGDIKRPYIRAADATKVEVEGGKRSFRCSATLTHQLETDQKGRYNQQPGISEVGKDRRLSIIVSALSSPLQTAVRSRYPSSIPCRVDLSNGGNDRFTKLHAILRAKLERIADTVTVATLWDYLKYKRNLLFFIDDCANASEQDASPDILLLDQRLTELKNRIVKDEKDEKSISYRRIAVCILKRVALAELVGSYIKERDARKAVPKRRRKKLLPGSLLKDRFTDLLFLDTIKYKEEQLGKENGLQEEAKKKLNYWIQLEEPLAMMAQRYGIAIMLLLPKKLTEKK